MSNDPSVPRPKSGVPIGIIIAIVAVVGIMFLCAVIGILTALLLPAVQAAREAARHNLCNNRIKQIELAILNYHEAYKSFPPAYIADANGKPMHSWRVLILPFLEEIAVYKQYDFNEPWDGPNNSQLAGMIADIYRCPSDAGAPGSTETNYVAVVGPETFWPGDHGVRIGDIKDGTSNTINIVEVIDSGVQWMEPRDLTLDQALRGINQNLPKPNLSSHHPGGAMVGYADGHVSFLDEGTPPQLLRSLLTKDGREPVSDPAFGP